MSGEYRIREVDGDDEEIADTLRELDQHCFPAKSGGAIPDFSRGHWWVVMSRGDIVGYAGLTQSTWWHEAAYLKRVGIHADHTGQGLQARLVDVRVRRARRDGFRLCITDCTTDNPASANTLIKRGFRVFHPRKPWALESSIYWRRYL